MSLILTIEGYTPDLDPTSWIAPNATITGKVKIGANSSVWYQVVIRGDVNNIIIGEDSNIQDAAIVHGTTGGRDTIIGDRVTVGHRAIIHGCTIEDECLIGMGAIILDDAVVKSNVIVAAGAVVTQKAVLESGYIYAGVPAKKVKKVDLDQINSMIIASAKSYVKYSKTYKESCK